jgi:hypothetical protein
MPSDWVKRGGPCLAYPEALKHLLHESRLELTALITVQFFETPKRQKLVQGHQSLSMPEALQHLVHQSRLELTVLISVQFFETSKRQKKLVTRACHYRCLLVTDGVYLRPLGDAVHGNRQVSVPAPSPQEGRTAILSNGAPTCCWWIRKPLLVLVTRLAT